MMLSVINLLFGSMVVAGIVGVIFGLGYTWNKITRNPYYGLDDLWCSGWTMVGLMFLATIAITILLLIGHTVRGAL